MLRAMREWGWVVFLLPVAVFLLDDWVTEWHHHGHDTLKHILVENLVEDLAVALVAAGGRAWHAAVTASIHVECPNSNFQWMMHPRQAVSHCPRCGIVEPE